MSGDIADMQIAAMDAIAALCMKNKGTVDIEIPEWIQEDGGALGVSFAKPGVARFTYTPETTVQ